MEMTRRSILKLAAAASAAVLHPRNVFAANYRVGVGRDANAYAATQRAIQASGEWPSSALPGRTVVIKPNLVTQRTAETGATTDPEVVRAIVDRALADGAAAVNIAEVDHFHFTICGYDFFRTYDPNQRVTLVRLQDQPPVLAPVSGGLAYHAIYTSSLILRSDVMFVSVGKMKTHSDSVATLTMKNLFGLPTPDRYLSYNPVGRFAMHDRSMHQTVVDLNRLRPVHFAVIDAVWAMEGVGPFFGDPVRLDTVLAGRNALAVDRVGLALMQLPQWSVRHLDYAAQAGLGPADLSDIAVVGDSPVTHPFTLPIIPPFVEYPRVSPAVFNPSAGQRTTVGVYCAQPCRRVIEILRLYDDRPAVDTIRTLAPWGSRNTGSEFIAWDGRAEDGALVPPGRYAAHVRAVQAAVDSRPMDGLSWIWITS